MFRIGFCALLLATTCSAANWTEYRIGQFRVVSDAGDKPARERLNELEQLRHVLGVMLGQDTLGISGPGRSHFETVWPIQVVLFSNSREYGPHALKTPFIEGGSAMLGAWTADVPLPRDVLRALAKMLIDANAGRMPDEIETGLCDLFSTIKVSGPKGTIGTPLPAGELSPDRLRAWAMLQLLATNPEYNGKLRVFLNNLQGASGDMALATRNAFGLTVAQLKEKVDAYVSAGRFEPAPISGEPLNPMHDFVEKGLDRPTVEALLAELGGDGKTFPPESPRGLVALGNKEALEAAAKANPRWGEPHFRLADLQTNSVAELNELKTAVKLDPRNSYYWQVLAQAQAAYAQFMDADKSWQSAMKAAITDEDRAKIKQARADLDNRRVAHAAEEKKAAEDDIQHLKQAAAAEVHAAETATNKKLGGLKPGEKPEQWWEDPPGEKLSGMLARVDCLTGGPMRLTVNIDGGGTIKLLIRDPKNLTVHSNSGVQFGCGVQRPVRKIRLIFNVNANAKLDTVGDVAMVDFP